MKRSAEKRPARTCCARCSRRWRDRWGTICSRTDCASRSLHAACSAGSSARATSAVLSAAASCSLRAALARAGSCEPRCCVCALDACASPRSRAMTPNAPRGSRNAWRSVVRSKAGGVERLSSMARRSVVCADVRSSRIESGFRLSGRLPSRRSCSWCSRRPSSTSRTSAALTTSEETWCAYVAHVNASATCGGCHAATPVLSAAPITCAN
mmetsp:Transcript_33121/g.69698  ORF Transcript_33121/g.69698 Transcript_33121/m.69698 type:complete len:211 (+) Transcript_33121:995-1627(+)